MSVMLFEGWGVQFAGRAWETHPFHPANNVNGIDGDANGDGKGLEIHTLADRKVTALQEAYVRKVIDTVGDLDNVLYEISNENHPPSSHWQYYMIDFIHDYEKGKPYQHPVGMTFTPGGALQTIAIAETAGVEFGNTDQVWCSSCHDVHNTANGKFLRINNAGSNLCLACHNK